MAITMFYREENFHLSKTKIVPIMATDDEHKLSHISTIYYEDIFFLWEEKEFKDAAASAECYHSGLCRPKIEYTD